MSKIAVTLFFETFRMDSCILGDIFFNPMFSNNNENYSLFARILETAAFLLGIHKLIPDDGIVQVTSQETRRECCGGMRPQPNVER